MIRITLFAAVMFTGCRENHVCHCAYVTGDGSDSTAQIFLFHGSRVSAENTCTAIERKDRTPPSAMRTCMVK